MREKIGDLAGELPSLRAVMVTAMPDCLLFDDWHRADVSLAADRAAAYFGDLIRANHAGLKSMDALSMRMQVTVEADDILLVIREIRDNFVVTAVFDAGSPLGMVRLFVERILSIADETLPKLETKKRPKGVLLVDFMRKYAADPHAVLKRASLRSGIPLSQLRSPGGLSDAQVEKLQVVAQDLMGLDHINI